MILLGDVGLIKFDTYPQLVNGNDAYVGVINISAGFWN